MEQYSGTEADAINDIGADMANGEFDYDELDKDVTYIIPKVDCPKCGKENPEQEKDPLDMLFSRHQLVIAANL